jgi:stage II sporulation protein AB (anti-sigma F factor)
VRQSTLGKTTRVPGNQWSFPAEPQCVAAARRLVANYADAHCVPDPPLADLKLAVSEAVTNSIVHAFRSTDAGTVTIAIDVRPRESVTVCVADEGQGLTPRNDSPGAGLGLELIHALATSVEVRTPPRGRGTEIRMTFALAG